ncbi:MAG: lipoate--protein ligase family protein [Nibricoccus sp.]
MQLDLLPTRHGSAAENMAIDFLLLQAYPTPNVRFRHYGWHRPAFTFGYGQTLEFVRSQLPAEENVEICRRPTGGGVVDHRNDWTYCLVIPAEHVLCEARATESYRLVHTCIRDAFISLGEHAELNEATNEAAAAGPGVCFTKAEVHDVVKPQTRAKIAGAAQKRSKRGMLFQGSIARATMTPSFDWERFQDAFTSYLAQALETLAQHAPWPDIPEEMLQGLIDQYSSEDWNGYR